MKLALIQETRPYAFKWWSGTDEPYEACFEYEITEAPEDLADGTIFVAVGWREAYGANRRRILVFRNQQTVLAEFVGADDWENSRYLIWPLKMPGSNRKVSADDEVPVEFRGFELGPCTDWITGPSSRQGIGMCIREDNHEGLIRVALIREQHKTQVAPATVARDEPQLADPNPAPAHVEPKHVEAPSHVIASLAQLFHECMIEIHRRAKKECGYHATRFIQMVHGQGGVDAARALLAKTGASDGLTTLWEHGRLDISVEAQVLRPEFAPLFTDEERAIARKILADYGYTA